MINKKILLGKVPQELGMKDAVHVAIVSVRAAEAMEPGTKCSMNADGEAETNNSKSIGVADPFLKKTILRGDYFNLVLNPDVVDNVTHVWDHPKFSFAPPVKPVKENYTIAEAAKEYGVTYKQMMDALAFVLQNDESAPYPGTKTQEELEEMEDNFYTCDVWSEYAGEILYNFENMGSECCPEYAYPEVSIFEVK